MPSKSPADRNPGFRMDSPANSSSTTAQPLRRPEYGRPSSRSTSGDSGAGLTGPCFRTSAQPSKHSHGVASWVERCTTRESGAGRVRVEGGPALRRQRQSVVHLEARSCAGGKLEPLRLLPVTVADEGMPAAPIALPAAAGRMEIALVGGERIVVGADVDAAALARVVNALSRR
jgi:hypothetical protein